MGIVALAAGTATGVAVEQQEQRVGSVSRPIGEARPDPVE